MPELELELQPGTLGGRFNTIEGLLTAVKEQLSGQNPFVTGDSASGTKMGEFIENLTKVRRFEWMQSKLNVFCFVGYQRRKNGSSHHNR